MFLKKIKNNNRGADIAIIGTNYLLILVVICCAIIDLTVIEYSKMVVVTILKQCEMYALAKNYDNEEMWMEQNFTPSQDVLNDIRDTFVSEFSNAVGSDTSFFSGVSTADNKAGIDGSGVAVTFDKKGRGLIITVPKVYYTPKKILHKFTLKTGGPPFISLGTKRSSGSRIMSQMDSTHAVSKADDDIIRTGASCKIAFIPQGAFDPYDR